MYWGEDAALASCLVSSAIEICNTIVDSTPHSKMLFQQASKRIEHPETIMIVFQYHPLSPLPPSHIVPTSYACGASVRIKNG